MLVITRFQKWCNDFTIVCLSFDLAWFGVSRESHCYLWSNNPNPTYNVGSNECTILGNFDDCISKIGMCLFGDYDYHKARYSYYFQWLFEGTGRSIHLVLKESFTSLRALDVASTTWLADSFAACKNFENIINDVIKQWYKDHGNETKRWTTKKSTHLFNLRTD